MGQLLLGKLRKEYISDQALRDIVANTVLDINKMKRLEDEQLLLITSVIYSERCELQGERKQQVIQSNWCCLMSCIPLKLCRFWPILGDAFCGFSYFVTFFFIFSISLSLFVHSQAFPWRTVLQWQQRSRVAKSYWTIIRRARVGYKVIDSQQCAQRRVGYNNLVSNKREWDNWD